jgi:phospholipid/cholesterol/gamma-HCH transport system permease protein
VLKDAVSALDQSDSRFFWKTPLPQSYVNFIGRKVLRFLITLQTLGAFGLITLGVMCRRGLLAHRVIRPLLFHEIVRSGLRLLPMALFLAVALGLVVIGQTVSLLSRVGANEFLGIVMVTAVVRELGPLFTALLVLTRVGTVHVIELGTARALGEVEALESMTIDPIHYLVVPRVIGMALGTFVLTVYLILAAVVSGYAWAFIQDVPLEPGDYFRQLASALRALDFGLMAAKSCLFGSIIALVTCCHGLSQPLGLNDVSRVTLRAVAHSIVACVLIDALFIVVYLAA